MQNKKIIKQDPPGECNQARKKLIIQAGIKTTHGIPDIGCGTGTLIRMIEHLRPDIEFTGPDPDLRTLMRAKKKPGRSEHVVQFDQGYSGALLYPHASFDRISYARISN